jgi:heptosyltransferase-2
VELFSSVDAISVYPAPDNASGAAGTGPDQPCDIALDLQGNRHSRAIVRRLGAAKALSYRRPRFARFFTVYLPWIWKGAQPHTVESYFRTLRPLGITYSGENPSVVADVEVVNSIRAEIGDGPFVGICPGSSSPHKSWGEDRFAELAAILAREVRVLLIGSEEDRSAVNAILEKASGNRVDFHIGKDIGRIAGCLTLCGVTVTNDSGLMHLAGAVGSRPVAIFGPTSPLLGFAPAFEGSVVLSLGLDCSPCSYHGNKPCRLDRRYCMEGITPEHVSSVVRGMMNGG